MWIHLLPCGTGIGPSFSHLVVRRQGEQWSSLMGIVSTILITHSELPDRENWKVLNIALVFFRHSMTHSRDHKTRLDLTFYFKLHVIRFTLCPPHPCCMCYSTVCYRHFCGVDYCVQYHSVSLHKLFYIVITSLKHTSCDNSNLDCQRVQ